MPRISLAVVGLLALTGCAGDVGWTEYRVAPDPVAAGIPPDCKETLAGGCARDTRRQDRITGVDDPDAPGGPK